MREINLPPFYVGQKVICVQTHSLGMVIKNTVHSVTGAGKFSCGSYWVSVGIKNPICGVTCGIGCGGVHATSEDMAFDISLFAPIQETFQSITLEKVLENETELIGAN